MTSTLETATLPHRGRIKWIILLSLIAGMLGATAGFFLAGKPQYKSVGMIQIKPFTPGVFDDSSPIPMFDAYVDSQVAIMQSRRTVDMAMQNPEWKALGRGLSDQSAADLQSSLSVSRQGGTIVTVTFLDPDPRAARIAVGAVIQAYQTIYDEANTGDENRRSQILDDLKTRYMTELARLRNAMQQDGDFGPEALDITYQFKVHELNRIESEIQQTRMNIRIAQAAADGQISATRPSAAVPAATGPAMTIAANDPEPGHNLSDPPKTGDNLAMMRLREMTLVDQVSQYQADLKSLAARKYQADALSAESANVQDNLNKTKSRIQQLNIENQLGGRISVISDGETPLSPDNDPRIKTTILGFIVGMALAFPILLFTTIRKPCKKTV
ncbi:MAG TPA: hypothetical protein VM008_11570 [Phycisphaerae bacterium]|nr:hypothetical protein [Phycisphaerae bacterium]